jgi:hypothetical protein
MGSSGGRRPGTKSGPPPHHIAPLRHISVAYLRGWRYSSYTWRVTTPGDERWRQGAAGEAQGPGGTRARARGGGARAGLRLARPPQPPPGWGPQPRPACLLGPHQPPPPPPGAPCRTSRRGGRQTRPGVGWGRRKGVGRCGPDAKQRPAAPAAKTLNPRPDLPSPQTRAHRLGVGAHDGVVVETPRVAPPGLLLGVRPGAAGPVMAGGWGGAKGRGRRGRGHVSQGHLWATGRPRGAGPAGRGAGRGRVTPASRDPPTSRAAGQQGARALRVGRGCARSRAAAREPPRVNDRPLRTAVPGAPAQMTARNLTTPPAARVSRPSCQATNPQSPLPLAP